jgi:hypothetical protein
MPSWHLAARRVSPRLSRLGLSSPGGGWDDDCLRSLRRYEFCIGEHFRIRTVSSAHTEGRHNQKLCFFLCHACHAKPCASANVMLPGSRGLQCQAWLELVQPFRRMGAHLYQSFSKNVYPRFVKSSDSSDCSAMVHLDGVLTARWVAPTGNEKRPDHVSTWE